MDGTIKLTQCGVCQAEPKWPTHTLASEAGELPAVAVAQAARGGVSKPSGNRMVIYPNLADFNFDCYHFITWRSQPLLRALKPSRNGASGQAGSQRPHHFGTNATMLPNDDSPTLTYDEWHELIYRYAGRFNAQGAAAAAFAGQVTRQNISGLDVLGIGYNAPRVDRTRRDISLDGIDHYCVVLQVAGQSTIMQNEEVATLEVGQAILLDGARPVTTLSASRATQLICYHLPRRSLISHLGSEPRGGSSKCGDSLATRLLGQLGRDAMKVDESLSPPANAYYMRLIIYDIVAALFSLPGTKSISSHSDRLFARICKIIESRFAEPDFGPNELAAEAGISLRYLQKLFTVRGYSCSHLIKSIRLDYAAQLLRRRDFIGSKQPLSEIAYACGFTEYTQFWRAFRTRFGKSPSARGSDAG
jgi:AraC-like DNA-binding protein